MLRKSYDKCYDQESVGCSVVCSCFYSYSLVLISYPCLTWLCPSFLSSFSRAPKGMCRQYLVLFSFALLLLADLSASLYLLLIYGTIQDASAPECRLSSQICPSDFSALTVVLAVYPLAYVASPIIGLMSLLFWLPFWIRRFIEWNLGSMLSACASVVAYLWFYDDLQRMQVCIAVSQVVVKFVLAIVAQVHLASMLRQSDDTRRKRLRSTQGDFFTAGSVLETPIF